MQSKAPKSRDENSIVSPFRRVVADWKGPLKPSREGYQWMLTISCKEIGLIYPAFGKRKAEAPKLFKVFLNYIRSKGFEVKLFSSDADSTFISRVFRKLLEEWQIKQKIYLRGHLGSAAERAILVSVKRANAILLHAMMTHLLWKDAMMASVRIWNRLVNIDSSNPQLRQKTRIEFIEGKRTDWSMARVPLCDAYPVIHSVRFGHFTSKILPGKWINLGMDDVVFTYKLLDLNTQKEILWYHVWFDESMLGRRDALTQSDQRHLRGLERLKPGQTPVKLSKYERKALKLRKLYSD